MKKILFALTMITGLLLPLTPRAQAASDLSLNLFYDNLSDQGSWIEVADYGYCFQPNVATGNANWRPYSDGYWAYTDVGWTWVSYEDFGWATYHYGRWSRLADYGWVWVPGYEWAPAWVSWRTGGDYIGWAPLPPSGHTVFEGAAITGQVDVEFDIGPQYYNFVDLRYIGEPVLRDRIVEPTRNVTIISSTVNVTNITYNNSIVYNYGPDYNRLNQYSTRPIQRLSLQRETTVGANLGAQGGGRNFNRVNGNQLMVVAPTIQKSQKLIAPKQVKAKVQQPKIEHGWQGISNRQQVQAEMKKENAKNVPPPTFQPQKGRKAEAAAGGQNAAAAQPNETARGNERNQPAKNQPADRAARQGRNNGQRQNGAAEARQGNGNANANAQGQADTRAERKAAREQKAQERSNAQKDKAQQAGQQQNESAQIDQERKAGQANRADRRVEQGADREQKAPEGERANAGQEERRKDRQARKAEQQSPEKPDQPRARQGRQAAQAEEPRAAEQTAQPKQARPAQSAEQPPRAERPERAQPEQRQERAKQKQQDDQNPDAPRKAKKKGQQEEEKPDQPQP